MAEQDHRLWFHLNQQLLKGSHPLLFFSFKHFKQQHIKLSYKDLQLGRRSYCLDPWSSIWAEVDVNVSVQVWVKLLRCLESNDKVCDAFLIKPCLFYCYHGDNKPTLSFLELSECKISPNVWIELKQGVHLNFKRMNSGNNTLVKQHNYLNFWLQSFAHIFLIS